MPAAAPASRHGGVPGRPEMIEIRLGPFDLWACPHQARFGKAKLKA